MASSYGRLLFPKRVKSMPNGGSRTYVPKPTFGYVTKASKKALHEYMSLYNSFFGNVKVHRAVCEAFHGPAPEGKPVVIHKDEDAKNNVPDNLKWGTQKENLNCARFIEYCKSRTGSKSPTNIGRARKRNAASTQVQPEVT